jgi:hypothetical protein
MKKNDFEKLADKIVSILRTLNEADEDVNEILKLIETYNNINIIKAMGKINHILKIKRYMLEEITLNDFEIIRDIANKGFLSQLSGMVLNGYMDNKNHFGFF